MSNEISKRLIQKPKINSKKSKSVKKSINIKESLQKIPIINN